MRCWILAQNPNLETLINNQRSWQSSKGLGPKNIVEAPPVTIAEGGGAKTAARNGGKKSYVVLLRYRWTKHMQRHSNQKDCC
jgi:hypothetical protein